MARVQMTQAVAADYADAMLVARRAKNVLFFFLSLVLLIQLGVFFVARYVPGLNLRGVAEPAPTVSAALVPDRVAAPATHPADFESPAIPTSDSPTSAPATTRASITPPIAPPAPVPAASASTYHMSVEAHALTQLPAWPLEYVVAATGFLGVGLSIVLAVVLLLIILMALVGKPKNLTGISHVTGAFSWSIVLIVLLFPWQALLNSNVHGAAVTSPPASVQPGNQSPDMKIPGVLYTYPELVRDHDFSSAPLQYAIFKWSRFVAFPVLSLIILLMVQVRSSQGWRSAVGDAEVIVDGQR